MPLWWAAVHQTLAQQDAGLPWLEVEPADLNTEIILFRFGLIAQIVQTLSDKVRQEGILRETAARSTRIPRAINQLCAMALMAGRVDQ